MHARRPQSRRCGWQRSPALKTTGHCCPFESRRSPIGKTPREIFMQAIALDRRCPTTAVSTRIRSLLRTQLFHGSLFSLSDFNSRVTSHTGTSVAERTTDNAETYSACPPFMFFARMAAQAPYRSPQCFGGWRGHNAPASAIRHPVILIRSGSGTLAFMNKTMFPRYEKKVTMVAVPAKRGENALPPRNRAGSIINSRLKLLEWIASPTANMTEPAQQAGLLPTTTLTVCSPPCSSRVFVRRVVVMGHWAVGACAFIVDAASYGVICWRLSVDFAAQTDAGFGETVNRCTVLDRWNHRR